MNPNSTQRRKGAKTLGLWCLLMAALLPYDLGAAAPTSTALPVLANPTNGALRVPTNFFEGNTQKMVSALSDYLGGVSAEHLAALAPVTYATIADMTNSTTVTNMNYAKAYSGTNGIGGGFFELMHTNGLVVNFGTVWPSKIPKKFLVRTVRSPLNPEWWGAKHDANTDDGPALQSMFNMMTNGGGTVALIPNGVYRFTNTLVLTNHQPGTSFRIAGEGSVGRGPDGVRLYYDGTNGGTAMLLVGANASSLENFTIDGNVKAKFGLIIDAYNVEAGTAPSSGVQLSKVAITSTVGAGSIALAVSHETGGSTPQISEITMEDVLLQGTTGSDHGFKNLVGGNTKNFHFRGLKLVGFTNGVFLQAPSLVTMQNVIGGSCMTNITSIGTTLLVDGWQDESSSNFLNSSSAGANTVFAHLRGVEWHGVALPGSDDTIIVSQGALIMENCTFDNARTATSIPNIVISHPLLSASTPANITSIGNFYNNASEPPIYALDASSTNNWIGYRFGFNDSVTFGDATYGNYAYTNNAFVSENDTGGSAGALIKMKPYHLGGGSYRMDFLNVFGSLVAFGNRAYAKAMTDFDGSNLKNANGHSYVAMDVTNYAHGTSLTVDGSTEVFADITNSTSANVSILLTNCVIGKSGTLSLLSDGSARTISIFSGASLTPMSTNDTVNATNILTTASKRTLFCWSVRRGTATETNVVWWAKNAP